MGITAEQVRDLRDKTGAGMMDCKKALVESGGDTEKAIAYLREKGIAKAAKKAGRSTTEGIIITYIHPGDKLGAMVEINCETDFVAKTDDFRNVAKDIAMQVAATSPVAVRREEVPETLIAGEREIYRSQALHEKKPEKIIDKIVEGKLDKFFAESCLMEQTFIKDQDRTVSDVLDEIIAKLGENMVVRRFVRFRVGE
jgi:elongation factor Ts